MFIKIQARFYGDDRVREYMASNPEDAFYLVTVLDKSPRTIAWNMDPSNHEPQHFGWVGPTGWNKYRENLFKE